MEVLATAAALAIRQALIRYRNRTLLLSLGLGFS
jgi:hypothetical protein